MLSKRVTCTCIRKHQLIPGWRNWFTRYRQSCNCTETVYMLFDGEPHELELYRNGIRMAAGFDFDVMGHHVKIDGCNGDELVLVDLRVEVPGATASRR